MQNHYSLVYREEEREMMPTLKVRIQSFPPRLNPERDLTVIHADVWRGFDPVVSFGPWKALPPFER